MHCSRLSVYANPFIGLYARASDRLTLVGSNVSPHFESACAVLGTKVLKLSIGGSPLVGIYSCLNSKGVIVPSSISREEKRLLDAQGIGVCVSSDKMNAFGNNIVANDRGAIANKSMGRPELAKFSEALGVPVEPFALAGHETVGSVCVATNKGFICHNECTDEEVAFLESVFKVKGGNGTVNMGLPYIALGLVANSKGYLAGETTSGFEMSRIDERLEFV